MFERGLEATDLEVKECLNKYRINKNEYILFVGTLSPRKNDMVMIKAYIEYKKRGGQKKLVLAGNVASKSESVRRLVFSSDYKEDIILSGYITEKEKRIFYYNAAMLLFPSRLEGFGFPLLEAMQAEIPVITSKASCMPEIAKDAAIYLNDIDNEKELCECILKVESLSQEEKRDIIKRGMQRVAFFDTQNFEKSTYHVMKSL